MSKDVDYYVQRYERIMNKLQEICDNTTNIDVIMLCSQRALVAHEKLMKYVKVTLEGYKLRRG